MNMIRKMPKKIRNKKSQRVKDLSFAGQMSIWGIRLLATGYREDMDVTKTLIEGFKKCNAMRAGSNLLFLMEIVFSGLTQNLYINCACNPDLTKDELNFLNLFSMSQHSSNLSVDIGLLDFLTESAANNAIPIFYGYGNSMRDAGLLFPVFDETQFDLLSISNLMKPAPAFH